MESEESRLDALRDLELPPFLPGEQPPTSTNGMRVYSPEGKPLDGDTTSQWIRLGQWKCHPENYRVTELHSSAYTQVSTTYLGSDGQWREGGPIRIWETMIFSEDKEIDLRLWRYSTRAAAMAGHQKVVDALAEAMGNPPRTEVKLPWP